MAHNVTTRDNVFAVREAAWHGLADVLTDYPTRAEAQQLAHPWEPVAEDVYRKLDIVALRDRVADAWKLSATSGDRSATTLLDTAMAFVTSAQQERLIPGSKLNARSDDGEPLGVVSDGFELVTNTEMWDVAEALQGADRKGDVMFETSGSLKGGRKVWILIRLAEPVHVSGDPRGATIPYYALQNAHDGTGKFRGQATFTRIVCDNTAQGADLDAQMRGTEFEFSHTGTVHDKIEAARAALAGWRESVEDWRAWSEHMASFQVSEREARDFLERFIPVPKGEIISDLVRSNIDKARAQWTGCYQSVTCEGTRGTGLGLVNASIEYAQHERKRQSAESGFKRAYLDRSRLTELAVELAKAVSGV